jgi:hypothetical protein
MREVIPSGVFEAVQGHLRARAESAQVGWESASDEEDALTGDFCGALRSGWDTMQASNGAWRWRVQYKKFGGRGNNAFEKDSGADGIVQVEVHGPSGEIATKGVLFQAKKVAGSSRSDLPEQTRKMEDLAPRGSAVFEFGPNGYRAAASTVILREITNEPRRIPHPHDPIGEYLADQFLVCVSGLRGMYYDAVRKILVVPVEGANRVVPLSLRHRVRLEVVHESQFVSVNERLRR